MNRCNRLLLIFWFLAASSLYAGTHADNFLKGNLSFRERSKELSIEGFIGRYYVLEDTILREGGRWLILPYSMRKIGCKISYKFMPNITFSLSGVYSKCEILNFNWIILALYSFPEFSLFSYSFLCSYEKSLTSRIQLNAGSGISLLKAKLFLNGIPMNRLYFTPLIAMGLKVDIKHSIYIGIFSKINYPLLKLRESEITMGQLKPYLPSINVNLGYKFNLGRR